MKSPIYVLAVALVVAVASWAYEVNYRTKAALENVAELRAEIAQTRETISVLRVEWAWLNRPERLERLTAMHFDRLGLMPLDPQHFGELSMVAYPVEDPAAISSRMPLNRDFRLPMTMDEVTQTYVEGVAR
ncbi:cell division protein FtsL [Pontivivens ytuae]|uniref:Cell division protein FtsL n=1 Tax=Pontivivens ytuae TaxID=2789856 RepID=A0A7S9LQR9_9RHOB|nr:cell division protein FtsL [Pontivivens ytuae]QPH53010.1 cell division protein FtsL [Pontivivens ytuae]